MRRNLFDDDLREALLKLPKKGVGALVKDGGMRDGSRTWDLTYPSDPDYEEDQAMWELQGFPKPTSPIWRCTSYEYVSRAEREFDKDNWQWTQDRGE